LKNCESTFFIPNSFTPNNDGLNDIFKPIITGELLNYDFSIYNRYGQLVFRTSDVHQGWNGIFNAQQQNSGTFTWLCHYQFKNDAERFAKGTVVLIR
jgi:gliding motility-associated-like protein